MNAGNRKSCRELFKNLNILPLYYQYILSLLLFVVKNINMFKSNSVVHCLPPRIKILSSDMRKFKSTSKKFLLEGSVYTIQEYFDWNLLHNPSTGNLPVINDC